MLLLWLGTGSGVQRLYRFTPDAAPPAPTGTIHRFTEDAPPPAPTGPLYRFEDET